MRAADRLFDGARQPALGLGEAGSLVHGLVPGLLFGGDIGRGWVGPVLPAGGGRVHDLAGAGRIAARRHVGARLLAVAVLRIVIAGPVVGPA